MAAPIWDLIAAMVDVGANDDSLPLSDRLTSCIAGTAKAGKVNLSWQVLAHITGTDKERRLVQDRVGCNQGGANAPPLHIVGIGKAGQHQLLADELGES
ncbi:hypothetical protein D3C85_1650600 [compost metagenome]